MAASADDRANIWRGLVIARACARIGKSEKRRKAGACVGVDSGKRNLAAKLKHHDDALSRDIGASASHQKKK